MMGIPKRLAVAISRFWRTGTSSAGNSTPKSPRATITPSHNASTASICSMASCFSILAMTGTCLPVLEINSLISMISWGLRTNESATQSTPWSRPNIKSSRSLSVIALTERYTPGKLTPLLFDKVPPTVTRQCKSPLSRSTDSTTISTRPSSSIMQAFGGTSSAK